MQFRRIPRNKPRRCGHGKTIHYVTHIKLRKRGHNYCRFPAAGAEITSQREKHDHRRLSWSPCSLWRGDVRR
jgi:hypothetical protein